MVWGFFCPLKTDLSRNCEPFKEMNVRLQRRLSIRNFQKNIVFS